jgi:hypothetical protein
MWLPNISLKTWLNKYPELKENYPEICSCGVVKTNAIPFVSGDWVGLKYPTCNCGKKNVEISILKTREQRDEFRKMLEKL